MTLMRSRRYPKGVIIINKVWWWIPILLLVIGLRGWRLGQIPQGLNRDEASLGYTAWSLLKSGHDEWGQPWPINIKSFGDWKLPAYSYILLPVVASLGIV